MSNFRREIIDTIQPYFHKDSRYYLLVCDMGFGVIDDLKGVPTEEELALGRSYE